MHEHGGLPRPLQRPAGNALSGRIFSQRVWSEGEKHTPPSPPPAPVARTTDGFLDVLCHLFRLHQAGSKSAGVKLRRTAARVAAWGAGGIMPNLHLNGDTVGVAAGGFHLGYFFFVMNHRFVAVARTWVATARADSRSIPAVSIHVLSIPHVAAPWGSGGGRDSASNRHQRMHLPAPAPI